MIYWMCTHDSVLGQWGHYTHFSYNFFITKNSCYFYYEWYKTFYAIFCLNDPLLRQKILYVLRMNSGASTGSTVFGLSVCHWLSECASGKLFNFWALSKLSVKRLHICCMDSFIKWDPFKWPFILWLWVLTSDQYNARGIHVSQI